MDFGFLSHPDRTRFCYMRLCLLEELLAKPRVLDALLMELEVPGKPAVLRRLSPNDKLRALEEQIEHVRRTRTSEWYEVPAPEVLAAALFRADLPDKLVLSALGDVRRESALAMPVAEWLANRAHVPHIEVPLGTKRIDVLGYKEGGFLSSESIIGIELKNEITQLERGLDQMTTFAEYTHAMYLACTPALAAEYLDKHASAKNVKHWDPHVFQRKLEHFGFGLLLVEGNQVFESMEPQRRIPERRRLDDLRATLRRVA